MIRNRLYRGDNRCDNAFDREIPIIPLSALSRLRFPIGVHCKHTAEFIFKSFITLLK